MTIEDPFAGWAEDAYHTIQKKDNLIVDNSLASAIKEYLDIKVPNDEGELKAWAWDEYSRILELRNQHLSKWKKLSNWFYNIDLVFGLYIMRNMQRELRRIDLWAWFDIEEKGDVKSWVITINWEHKREYRDWESFYDLIQKRADYIDGDGVFDRELRFKEQPFVG